MNFIRKTMKRMTKSLPPTLNHNDFAFGSRTSPRPFRQVYSLQPAETADHVVTFDTPVEVPNDTGHTEAAQQVAPPAHVENGEPHTEAPGTSAEASEVEQTPAGENQDAQEIKQEEEDGPISENGRADLQEAVAEEVVASPGAQEQNPPVVPLITHNAAQLFGAAAPNPAADEPSHWRRAAPLQRNGAHANLASMNRYEDMDLHAQQVLQSRERQVLRTQEAFRIARDIAQEMWTLLQEQVAEHNQLRDRITQAQNSNRRVITNGELAEISRRTQAFDQRMQTINQRMAVQGQSSVAAAGPSQPSVQRAAAPSPPAMVKPELSPFHSLSPSGSNKRAREEDEPVVDGAEPRSGRRTRVRREVVAEPQPVRRSARLRALAARPAEPPAQELPPPRAQPRTRPPNSNTSSLCIGLPAEDRGQASRQRKRSRADRDAEVEDEDEAQPEETTGDRKSKRSKRRRT